MSRLRSRHRTGGLAPGRALAAGGMITRLDPAVAQAGASRADGASTQDLLEGAGCAAG
jgi:hypothetical protein